MVAELLMDVGIFQLLPQPGAVSDRELIEQARSEVDFAEAAGLDSVWLAEHQPSPVPVGADGRSGR